MRRGGTGCVHTLSPSCPRRHLGFAPDMVTCPLLRGQQESADCVSQTCRAGEGQGGSPWKPTEASQVHIDWWLDHLPGPCAPSPLCCFCLYTEAFVLVSSFLLIKKRKPGLCACKTCTRMHFGSLEHLYPQTWLLVL